MEDYIYLLSNIKYKKVCDLQGRRLWESNQLGELPAICKLHGNSSDNKEARGLKFFTMNIVNLNFGETLSREQMKQVTGGRDCYCGGGLDPWSCPVAVNDGNPKNCTEICAETDCGEMPM
ncbi:hypothetical protein SAMN05660226_00124 [Parapedobacter luteus]|uniref:Natural product n=1 Tax=Parapedobacter luteus TaxID=623280 RepID=A0A1T4ZUV7_9SPHI|nr:hypothetical protein [Parapedobacter luteus]SKB26478.1 hypothetical protein SAMN05660226_00124 [Parapedobacter luteus]